MLIFFEFDYDFCFLKKEAGFTESLLEDFQRQWKIQV